jgi:Indoleamine 2,3-dioxygenase
MTSTFHIVLNNWRLSTLAGGSPYTTDALVAEHLDLLYNWTLQPIAQQLRMFMTPVILAEARGARILPTIVGLVSAAAQQNAHETVYLLDKLRAQIQEIVSITSHYIRKSHIAPDVFLTYIQPNLVWGLDEGDGLPASPSGAQVGIIQAFDSVLGIRRESPMGQVVLKGREYMPVPHRRFLATLDAAASIVRDFVEECAEPQMLALYNECIKAVRLWRNVHQKRGSLYLKGENTSADALGYASSGGLVGSHGMPVAPANAEQHGAAPRPAEFEAAMEERIQETVACLFPVEQVERATLDTAFQYLTAQDRERLLERR